MNKKFLRLFTIILFISMMALPGMSSQAQEPASSWSLPILKPELSPDGLTGYNMQLPLVMVVDENTTMQNLHMPAPSADSLLLNQSTTLVTGMTFSINYIAAGASDPWGALCVDFPASAKTAFEAAAVVLSNRMQSTVPITINACWSNLGSPSILGYSGGGPLHRNFSGAPKSNVWYIGTLANSLAGSDLSASADMNITYNSGFSWYYGTNGVTPAGQYDLVTVAAHEIAHGLNFSGSADYSGGNGSYGYGTVYPNIYDTFIENNAGTKITTYTNPSADLGTQLVSGSLWFNGVSANLANSGGRVKIYAPAAWSDGSSYSHLDYATFAGTKNSMMVYAVASGSSNHYPGNVSLGMLQDMGWKTPLDPTLVWTYCAAENGTCSFSGMKYVRFGASGSYFYSKYTNSVSCTVAVFGDPIPGTTKTCYYSSDPSPAISVNPTSWDFGSQSAGTTSSAKSFTVTNTGTANLVIGTLSATGEYSLSSNTCNSATVIPTGTCTFGVTFSPTSAGAKAGSISIPSNAPTSPTSVSLSGTGVAPAISVNPTSWDFGSQSAGTTSSAKSFTVTNTGTANLVIGTLSATGEYSLSSNTCNSATVVPTGTCTFGVTFSPTSAGVKAGSISIPSNAPTSPTSVSLSGTGVAPAISVNPTSWDFGSQNVGTTSSAKSFTVTNTGTANLVIGTLSVTGQYALSSNTCNSATVIPTGTCTFGVTFSPTSTGVKAGSISIPSNAPTSPTSVSLSGTGVAPAISVNPTSWDFGNQNVGTTSSAKSFTVTNTGTANLVIGTLSVTGQYALSSNTCNSATVIPTGTCTFGVTFSPTSTGVKAGSISIPSNAPTSPTSVSLSGSGVAPAISVNPSSWDFGSQNVGTTSSAKSFTVTNTGTANLVIGTLSVTGQYALSSNTCNSATVIPAGTCTFGVTFSPTSTGVKAGSISIPSNAPTSPTSVSLSGTGIAPAISVNPISWDFGSQNVGTASSAKSFTVTNTGSANLVIGTLSVTGEYSLSSNTCNSATIVPSDTCSFNITFSPTSVGVKAGSISIPSNAPTSPTSVPLNGTGIITDGTAPTILSSVRVNPSPTNLSSVSFTVTFSESVTGVDISGPTFNDFSLTMNGASGAAVSGVSGTGSIYTVTVNTGSGNGTIRLNVTTGGAIVDGAGNPLTAGYSSGEVYSVIRTATFADVPTSYWAWQYIERLYLSGISGGCSNSPLTYCPGNQVTRAQMAIFLLRGMHGSAYTPPSATGTVFSDVGTGTFGAAWIEQLAAEGITSGCGGGKYCPTATVTRAQMAVFLVRARHGIAFVPPAATGIFPDVPVGSFGANFIEQLVADGITSGCAGGNYCPNVIVNRDTMAVFLVKAFNLP